MKPKKEVEAIHKHDVEKLLKNLGLFEKFKSGNIGCQFCKDAIEESNFGAIFPSGQNILFSCSKLECMTKLPKEKKQYG